MATATATMTTKARMQNILNRMPDDVTWDDLLDEISICQGIEAGLKDANEGRTIPNDEVWRRFGMEP